MNLGSASESMELQRAYLAALRKHLAAGPRASLRAAQSLGRRAVSDGIGTAGLTQIHARALMTLVPPGELQRTTNGKIGRASSFFVAALEPMDGRDRTRTEDDGELARLKETMRQGKVELAAAHRLLKRELARRKTIEAALDKSRRQHAELRQQALRASEQFRQFSHRMLLAQEEERRRISRELHDEIGQTLTAINVKLATLKMEADISAKAVRQTIRSTQRLVEGSMKTVHRFARSLRPPVLDDLGLIPALQAHLDAFTKQTGIPVRFTSFAGVEELAGEKRTVLYRVAQEAFANIAKHARASLVTMRIRKDGASVVMEIGDNGRGFDPARHLDAASVKRLGLLGMRERLEMVGGSFEVESEPDHGATVRAHLPFDGRKTRIRAGSGAIRK